MRQSGLTLRPAVLLCVIGSSAVVSTWTIGANSNAPRAVRNFWRSSCASCCNTETQAPPLLESFTEALALVEADANGWEVERYRTTREVNGEQREFSHLVLVNRNHGSKQRDVWVRFHGSNAVVVEDNGLHRELVKSFSQSASWIVEAGRPETVYAFMTTETTAYGGYFHDLCQDEGCGLNIDYLDLGDWGYALVGGEQLTRHLAHLQAYGYTPGVSKVSAVGYSDGGWMSSMCALTGGASHAVAWAGWAFARFDEWKDKLSTSTTGMRLDVYVSAGDVFYNGTSGWYPAPDQPGSMYDGLMAITRYFHLAPRSPEVVLIEGFAFRKQVFANVTSDNVISCYVDLSRRHDHEWLFHQEAILKATARL